MSFKVVIPARYASSRLPGKVLRDIAGQPMIRHVWDRARESGAVEVTVATDDPRIVAACEAFGARAVLTDPEHRSGTDRLAEVVRTDDESDDSVLVNLQGDEPLLPGAVIRQVAANLAANPGCDIATLCEPIEDDDDVFDPSVVKVVADAAGHALYFSRAPVPWYRDAFAGGARERPEGAAHLRHVGIYAYRAGFLRRWATLAPSAIELAESLEQLRALDHGARIHVARACAPPGHGVDTAADLERVRAALGSPGAAR